MNAITSRKPKPLWQLALPVGLGSALLVSAGISPARALISDLLGDSIFGDIYSQLVSFFPEILAADQWISLLEDAINDPCASVPILMATPSEPGWCTGAAAVLGGDGSISGILLDAVGDLGIPDMAKARSTIQSDVDSAGETPDPFISNPELYGILLGNVSDRAATTLNTTTVLSEEGQAQMQEEIDQSGQIVQTIMDTSNEAQSYDSTQDVIKALARINAQQSVIGAMSHASSLKSRTDDQFTNLNLTNISRSLDEQNRDRQAKAATDGFQLLHLTAQSQLF